MTGKLTYSSFLNSKSGFYNNLPIFGKFWAKIKILKNRESHLLEDYISILLTNFGATRLTLLVAGGLFLSTPRVFLKYLPNGSS